MENYVDSPFQQLIQKASFKPKPVPSTLVETIMPLYQVIRFANQAAEKKQPVYITIEQRASSGLYVRTILKGVFRSQINKNKQIAFVPHQGSMLHLLKVDQILAVQLAE